MTATTIWPEARIGDIAELIRGVTYKKVDSSTESADGFVPVLRATNIDGALTFSDLVHVPSSYVSPKQYLQPGDSVIAASSGSRAVVGKAAILGHDWAGSFGAFCYVLRPNKSVVHPSYLGFYLQTLEYRQEISRRAAGVNINNLKRKDIESFALPLPPIPVQSRVVASIETHFTRLDAAVRDLEHVQANLKRYRASVLKAAVEGRLVPTEAELARQDGRDYEPASALLERVLVERRRRWEEGELAKLKAKSKTPTNDKWKAKYNEPEGPDSASLPELPEGWCWVAIDQLTVEGPQNGIYVPQSQYGMGTPIIRIEDYQDTSSRSWSKLRQVAIDEETQAKFALEPQDLIINRVNSPSHLGKCLVVEERHTPSVFESNMMKLKVAEAVSVSYLVSYLRSVAGRRRLIENAKWAVNQASINQQDVAHTPVPLPPRTEQDRIVLAIEATLSRSKMVSDSTLIALRRSKQLRQALLSWAFQGHLVSQTHEISTNSND